LWIGEDFDKELQKKAPDLMHWMSKRFVFEGNGSDGMEVAEAAFEYETVRKPGKIPERLERIRQLEETWEKLCLHNADKARLIKDKINLLRLLGKEYTAVSEFYKAEEAFEKALALNDKIQAGLDGELFFEMGDFYYDTNRYGLALGYFQKSLEWYEKHDLPNRGAIYHMMGMVYQEQNQMEESLQSYQRALDWYTKETGGYHLGGTYHQIGRVYGEQRKWSQALKYYGMALESEKEAGNESGLGGTYHEIGIVYAEQHKWTQALKYYRQALAYKEKAGNDYGMGKTYYQIGLVEEQKGQYASALDYYEKAVENLAQYASPNLSLAQKSLDRIRQKIKDQQSPADIPPQV
jgi:tetratricopeptide (TPR) repeat protein